MRQTWFARVSVMPTPPALRSSREGKRTASPILRGFASAPYTYIHRLRTRRSSILGPPRGERGCARRVPAGASARVRGCACLRGSRTRAPLARRDVEVRDVQLGQGWLADAGAGARGGGRGAQPRGRFRRLVAGGRGRDDAHDGLPQRQRWRPGAAAGRGRRGGDERQGEAGLGAGQGGGARRDRGDAHRAGHRLRHVHRAAATGGELGRRDARDPAGQEQRLRPIHGRRARPVPLRHPADPLPARGGAPHAGGARHLQAAREPAVAVPGGESGARDAAPRGQRAHRR
mmetsp:Transcript_16492/g.50498  ORF Transcript_16492/g.50498 Transcript_16492/m.50498 type:complete len:288 (-) Transcript_16492:1807-2670(-)